jgi:hypothetical protein
MRTATVSEVLVLLIAASTVQSSQGQPPAESPGLAVIAPTSFHDVLAPYVAHKKKQLPVELVALETIRKEQAGDDDAEKLKRFLYGRWKEKRIAYVLRRRH